MMHFSPNPEEHNFLTRMFLRDCALIMKMDRRGDPQWIWNFAALAISITLSSYMLFVLTLVVVLLRSVLPDSLNPLTASNGIVLLEIAVMTLSIGAWVDHRFRAFRHDVSAATRYMGRSDLVKWWLATLLMIACIAGVGVLVAASGSVTQ